MDEINKHIGIIKELCNANKVKFLYLFGSAAKGNMQPESDIDLLVDIDDDDPLSYSDHYFRLKFALEELLKKKIDLLEYKALNNPYLKKQIDNTKVQIYGKGN